MKESSAQQSALSFFRAAAPLVLTVPTMILAGQDQDSTTALFKQAKLLIRAFYEIEYVGTEVLSDLANVQL